MKEEWRDVTGHEDAYMVSNLGRVRSCARIVQHATRRCNIIGRILKPSTSTGYPVVNLCDDRGNYMPHYVHRLIGAAFIGEIPNGCYVHHKDGQKTNNHLDNLEIVTPGQNSQRSYDTGTSKAPQGSNSGRAKLTEEDVRCIRASCIKGSRIHGCHALATKYGVAWTTIRAVVNRESWRHVS